MEITTELTVNRIVAFGTIPAPVPWVLVKNTSDVVLPTPEAESWEYKPTNSNAVVQSRSTWVKYTPCTFNLAVDTTDATHLAILAAIKDRTIVYFNISIASISTKAFEFACYVTSSTDNGTDEGGYVRNITLIPCGDVDEDADIGALV
jgi:hypothetical protein